MLFDLKVVSWSCFLTSASCSSSFFLTFFFRSHLSIISGVNRFDLQFIVLLTDESRIYLPEYMLSSTNFEFKVDRSVSRSKLLPLLLFLPLPSIFDVYSSISLFLLTRSCFTNLGSFSKDFTIFVLLLTKSFSCLLNFSSSFIKKLIYGINLY